MTLLIVIVVLLAFMLLVSGSVMRRNRRDWQATRKYHRALNTLGQLNESGPAVDRPVTARGRSASDVPAKAPASSASSAAQEERAGAKALEGFRIIGPGPDRAPVPEPAMRAPAQESRVLAQASAAPAGASAATTQPSTGTPAGTGRRPPLLGTRHPAAHHLDRRQNGQSRQNGSSPGRRSAPMPTPTPAPAPSGPGNGWADHPPAAPPWDAEDAEEAGRPGRKAPAPPVLVFGADERPRGRHAAPAPVPAGPGPRGRHAAPAGPDADGPDADGPDADAPDPDDSDAGVVTRPAHLRPHRRPGRTGPIGRAGHNGRTPIVAAAAALVLAGAAVGAYQAAGGSGLPSRPAAAKQPIPHDTTVPTTVPPAPTTTVPPFTLVSNTNGTASYRLAGSPSVVVSAQGPCWVEAHQPNAQGSQIFAAILAPGQSETLRAPVFIRLGAPSAVTVTVNGMTLPALVTGGAPWNLDLQ